LGQYRAKATAIRISAANTISLALCPGLAAENAAMPNYRKILSPALLLCALVLGVPVPVDAAGLDCPEVGPGAVPDLVPDAKLVTSGNSADVSNEIRYLINRLQIERPNISNTEINNILIAAYCPAVAAVPGLSSAEKWRRMREFDALARQQLDANTMPSGSLIIADVPLPPAVYRTLRSQAAAVDQTPAQLMGAILTQAAGR
jgi:hypothetical protein